MRYLSRGTPQQIFHVIFYTLRKLPPKWLSLDFPHLNADTQFPPSRGIVMSDLSRAQIVETIKHRPITNYQTTLTLQVWEKDTIIIIWLYIKKRATVTSHFLCLCKTCIYPGLIYLAEAVFSQGLKDKTCTVLHAPRCTYRIMFVPDRVG